MPIKSKANNKLLVSCLTTTTDQLDIHNTHTVMSYIELDVMHFVVRLQVKCLQEISIILHDMKVCNYYKILSLCKCEYKSHHCSL